MSEAGRKDFTDKAQEKMTPESSKSTTDKLSETVTGSTDKAARGMQPDSQKTTGQSVSDKMGRSKDENVHGGSGESVLDKTKSALGMDKK